MGCDPNGFFGADGWRSRCELRLDVGLGRLPNLRAGFAVISAAPTATLSGPDRRLGEDAALASEASIICGRYCGCRGFALCVSPSAGWAAGVAPTMASFVEAATL